MALVTRRQVLGLASSLIALLTARTYIKTQADAPVARFPLRILATTDLHCWLASYDYYRDSGTSQYGLARLATLIAEARREATNVMLLDNGDLLQGNPLADFIGSTRGLTSEQVHPAIKALNQLKYDAATLGNHDFDYGLPFLERALAGAGFPYVCTNFMRQATGEPWFHPWTILERVVRDASGGDHTIRIGVFGVIPPQVAIWNRHQLQGLATVSDILDTARATVAKLREAGAQLVVALCHSGFGHPPYEPGDENAAYAVSEIEGVDVVIAGHSHRSFPDISYAELPGFDLARGTLNGKPAVMAGHYGSHLGVIDLVLSLEGGKLCVTEVRSTTRGLHGASVAADPAVMDVIAADHHAALAYARRPVGTLSQGLDSYFALVAPNPLLSLVAQVQEWAVRRAMKDEPELFKGHQDLPLLLSVAPFKCGGRQGPDYYTSVAAGPIAIRNVADIYMYPNLIEVVGIDGAGLREWLEMSAMIFRRIHAGHAGEQALLDRERPSFDFDVIHGVKYAIDVTQPERYRKGGMISDPGAVRILDLTYDGKPVKDTDRFLVATTNYRASGGGGFPGMDGGKTIYRSTDQMQELLVAWLREHPQVEIAAASPWRFAALPADATIVFESAPEAAQAIPAGSGISFIEMTPEGFGKFRLRSV